MGRKIVEIPKENEGFWRSWGVMQAALSQNMILSLPSVWGGKSLKFLRKMKDSVGLGGVMQAALSQKMILSVA